MSDQIMPPMSFTDTAYHSSKVLALATHIKAAMLASKWWLLTFQVTEVQGDLGTFDVIAETLRATNLGQLEADSEVNFER